MSERDEEEIEDEGMYAGHPQLWEIGANWLLLPFAVLVVSVSAGVILATSFGMPYVLGAMHLAIGWSAGSLVLHALFVGVLFGIGTLLFALRSRSRFWYGSIEIGFASYLFWRLLGGRDEGSLAFGLSALAAVYVLVRGLDNALTGWPKTPISGAVAKLADRGKGPGSRSA